jgi:hypothetical protein
LKAAFEAGDWKQLWEQYLGKNKRYCKTGIDWEGVGHKIGYYLNGAIQTAYCFLKTANRFY